MKKKMNVNNQIQAIHGMMDSMNAEERELFSDKLLSFLLFDSNVNTPSENLNNGLTKTSHTGLTKEELQLIKDLAKKTEELRNLLGDNPNHYL